MLFLLILGLFCSCASDSQEMTSLDAGASDPSYRDASIVNEAPNPLLNKLCKITIDCNKQSIPNEPKLACKLKIINGEGTTEYDGIAGIETRGRSSSSFPKKQYSLELRKSPESLESNASNLLGMGKEDDWILNGAYIDRSLFRNKFFYDTFQSLGKKEHFAPQSGFCTLHLDGEYEGIYLLGERIDQDNDRLDLAIDKDKKGGSFLVKQDSWNSPGAFRHVNIANGDWQLLYPKKKTVTEEEKSSISNLFDQWSTHLENRDDKLFSVLSMDSIIDYILIEELAKNNDAYYLSIHLWRNLGGLIHFSIWDLDLSFGQPEYNESSLVKGWIVHRPPMICRMAGMTTFKKALSDRWFELRKNLLTEQVLQDRIDSYVDIIAGEVEKNFERWPMEAITFPTQDNELYKVTNHQEEVSHIRTWLTSRLLWMDANIAKYKETCTWE